ncbi:MAG: fatty acid desaturase [Gammaproteobacteria bacterium]|nr:fatty acid desaturase [Gammaproteobacteria bacterium]
MSTAGPRGDFDLRAAKGVIHDLFEPAARVYWMDLLASAILAYGATALYLNSAVPGTWRLPAFLVAGVALYRVGAFMHELVHLGRERVPGFQLAWNLLYGIPLLTPSPMYMSHIDHHNSHRYGTPADGEYLPFGVAPASEILRFAALLPLLPVLAVARFLLLAPASWLHPGLRAWVLERATCLVINPQYRRSPEVVRRQHGFAWLEAACCAWLLAVTAALLGGAVGVMTLLQVYALVVFAVGLNWIRTLIAHHYRVPGRPVDHLQQMLDSVNFAGWPWLVELLCPVGLAYHALHHLFPALPYHNLGRAHRRLLQRLPADSPYRRTEQRGLCLLLRRLWARAAASGDEGRAVMAHWRGGARLSQPARAPVEQTATTAPARTRPCNGKPMI